MEKKDRNKWTNKFRDLGKKRSSREKIDEIINEVEKNEIPPLNEKCNDCSFILKQKEMML